jgi:GNAT superfamily N-acetyltransferase
VARTGEQEDGDRMRVDQLDPRDDAAFDEWFAVVEAADALARPGEPGSLRQEEQQLSLDALRPGSDSCHVLLAAHEGDRCLGAARLELPQRDNLHTCEVELVVHPDARRRGVARALCGQVERVAREHGRTAVAAYADEPPGSEGCSAGRLAALALGWEVVQVEVRRDIDLPLDPALVASVSQQCAPYAGDYGIRTWIDRCPDDLVDDRAELSRSMSTDVPLDRLDWREEVWDAARVRRGEELVKAMDRTVVNAGAVHVPTGRMVAYTQLAVPRARPERAYQWDTIVLSAHRGRRLATLAKLSALRELAALSPGTRFVSTWNAKENVAMIRVNDALGARLNGGIATVQKVLG